MIKGLGYLKYLKLSLIGFGISFFMVSGGNFVNAEWNNYLNGSYHTSPLDSTIEFNVVNKGQLMSNRFGQTKRLLALSSSSGSRLFFFWSINQKPYFYVNRDGFQFQGFVKNYYLCDGLMSGQVYASDSNCSVYSIDDSFASVVGGLFDSITINDYWGYYNYVWRCNGQNYLINQVQFYSSQYNKSIVFSAGAGGTTCVCHDCGNVENSLNLGSNIDYTSVSDSLIQTPPGFTPYGSGDNIEGGSITGVVNQVTGDIVTVGVTKSTALEWYRCNGYKTRMCYSSYGNMNDIYTGAGSVSAFALTGIDIEDVWFDSAWYRMNGQTGSSMSYPQWFAYWRNAFDTYKKYPQGNNPFVGVPVAVFTLMGNVNSYGLPYNNQSILEFCDLSLYTADYSAEYSGIALGTISKMSAIDFVDCQTSNQLNPDDGLPGDGNTDGTVGPIGSSWDGVTNRPGYHDKPGSGDVSTGNNLSTINDGKTFENNFFNLLKSSFKYPDTSGNGFIPSYIILALLGLVIFRFISH